MSDDAPHVDDAGDEPSPAIAALLADADTWHEPLDLDDRILAAIRSEAAEAPVPITSAKRRRPAGAIPGWLKAVAAIAIVVAGAAVLSRLGDDQPETTAATLAGTDLAPGASATVEFTDTPAGLKILIDVNGLPGAKPGEMYEAWISDGTIWVSAGTFHLRGGDGPIELWAGVADPRFHIITVTLEPVDGVAASSGKVVLKGAYSIAG